MNSRQDYFKLKYQKLRANAKAPEKARADDAGIDIFWCPDDNGIANSRRVCFLKPGENHLFATGLRFEIPFGWCMIVFNRSGVAAKQGVLRGACVIDSGYRGEIFIDLHNVSDSEQWFEAGDKIAQLVPFRIPDVEFEEVEEVSTKTERGEKGFGSSDEKGE